jgi:hypothetical protein
VTSTIVLAILLAGSLGLGPVDDAYISLRYAAHWAGGQGLCFNPGERVEGYTNFAWIALEAAAILVGFEPEAAMRGLGWISLGAVSATLFLLLLWHALPDAPVASGILAVAGSLNTTLICWASSGMESCLYSAFLLAGLLASLASKKNCRVFGTASLLVLAAMTRPEAMAFALPFCGIVYLRGRRVAEAVGVAGVFAIVYGLYFMARWTYFDSFLPNTFYAKLDYGSLALIDRGLRYTGRFLLAAWPMTLPSIACLFLIRQWPLWVRATFVVVATHLAVVIYEGGDHFAMYRFMTPLVPMMCALTVYAGDRIASCRDGRRTIATVTLAALALFALGGYTLGRARSEDQLERNELQRFVYEAEVAEEWGVIGRWLRTAVPGGSSLATIAVGAVGFHSGITIVDPHGVVDPTIARLEVGLGSGYAGHEKFDVAHVLSKRPGYFMIQNWLDPNPVPEWVLPELVWGDFSRAVLRDREFGSAYRYEIVRPIPGELIGLHVRKDLPPLHGAPLENGRD